MQNWYFTTSAFEAKFRNFSLRHNNVKSFVVWSDNGPYYHNTSVILWLSRVSEVCNMNLERYSFFEAQKGKTSLDSHFATFKFALKRWMKKGNDLLKSDDIVSGTKDNLKGTHVYEIHISRENEPPSAKTLEGITSYLDFAFTDKSKHEPLKTIVAKELTNTGSTTIIKPEKIRKLWPSYITNHCLSTGVTSDLDKDIAENVEPKYKKTVPKKKDKSVKEESTGITGKTNEMKEHSHRCPNCQKFYLRNGNMLKHINENNCTENTKTKSKTLAELKKSFPVVQAIGLANNIRVLNTEDRKQGKKSDKSENLLWCSLLLGSAKKTKRGKNHRFTSEQKLLIEECFDAGEKDKRKRYTT